VCVRIAQTGIAVQRQNVFTRFFLSGVLFTILGPCLFWLAYPLGPFLAVAMAELAVHSVRFITFRSLVFPAHLGYRVSLPRYVISALPVTLAGFASVALLQQRLDRTSLTLITTANAVVVGFLWSRFVYSRPVGRQ
jgi:putative flippase GtrA